MDYFEAYQSGKEITNVRRAMIECAMKKGVKAAAKQFGTTIKTVKRWVKRFREETHVDAIG